MKTIYQIGFLFATVLNLTACPLTRSEVQEHENKKVMQDSLINLQKSNADTSNRFQEIENDVRHLSGKVEVLEDRIEKGVKDRDKSIQGTNELVGESNKKYLALQEEVSKLSNQVQALQSDLAALKTEAASAPAASSSKENGGKKDLFAIADEQFKDSDWKKAAMSFQQYREKNPKGKRVPEASYKIGVCFQELGLKDDAKTFYEEVISKYPTAAEAKKAKTRLKSLK